MASTTALLASRSLSQAPTSSRASGPGNCISDALVRAVENPSDNFRVLTVPDIRAASA